ncbi:flagellar biosynthesis protein FlhF [Pollutimonas nitritireducens]|uniref:Flagellar biosynthesis protein FlhF n=1 Tax=Pollutimonas nitritireducens TaxID=2045209 RepID=A0A2N4UB13_9BURK|nr:flagellar biosynthesis protein FlhF [Pollutimonas nitritireducens]PLC52212.1 flagellar biosynthesis protein FlhF [Pollutimonas nitritireducens]
MNISRFFGSTNREAMRQVRMALGPDALIVSNRRINGGVEILASDATSVAVATEEPAVVSGFPTAPTPMPGGQRPASAASRMPAATASAPALEQEVDVMDAIGAMRGALETRIDELVWGNQLRRAPQAVSLFQTLLGYGFSTALLRAMLKRLPEQLTAKAALQWARNELVTHLPVVSSEDKLWTPGLALALVGPTGVGKTTTIAKLAARCLKRVGPDGLVLLTTDTYRIGAHEQLKIYGQIMRVPVHVVQDVIELRKVMQGIREDQTILIDNVGISQRDRYIAEQAAMLAGAGRQVSRLLVLNASSHGDTLDEVARTYCNDGGTPLKGCIISKVDEASRLGAALDTAIRYRLPIHYISTGQKVPENLAFPSAMELVDQALVHNQLSRALYAPTEADFAALMSLAKPPADDARSADVESRRKRLLPGLLSMALEPASSMSMEDLDAACAYIDEATAPIEAYGLWRSYTASKPDTVTLAGHVEHGLRIAEGVAGEKNHKHLLALHDQVTIKSSSGARGSLRASLLVAEDGMPLTSPVQQLGLADGWHSSCGASAQQAPATGMALHRQVQWLSEHPSAMPIVHLFEGGTQSLWRSISSLDVSWLTQCPATTRVELDACATTVGALGKTLIFHPVAIPVYAGVITEIAGKPAEDIALWVASETVEIIARQQDSLLLQVICVRIVNRVDGLVIKTLYGLSNMFALDMASDVLAAWLVLRAEAKASMRHAARAWQLLEQRKDAESLPKKAMLATQLGMAAWQYKQDPGAALARKVGGTVTGKPGLPSLTAMPAMLKLFALKEMVAV